MRSIPAFDSDGGKKTETAAAQKLQADMDKHEKDYFIPNFGVDRDIIDTQSNFKNAFKAARGKKALVQRKSIPACNSATFPGCLKAETAADQKLQADMDKHDKDYFIPNFGVDQDIKDTLRNFHKAGGKLSQMKSIPAFDSDGGRKTETAAAQKLQADMDKHEKDYFIPNFGVDREILDTQSNFKNAQAARGKKALVQRKSIPACNSADFPGCLKAETAADQKL